MQHSDIDGPATRLPGVSRDELAAYAEGRLDRSRRAEVAGFLACNPDLAAQVMRAVHFRERSGEAEAAAAPHRRRDARTVKLVAACLACALTGWAFATGLDDDGPLQGLLKAPEYVEDAVMSWRATDLRIAMESQIQTPALDTREVSQVLRIRMPVLPSDWRLLDAQVYPSEEGPGISMLLETTRGARFSLFAVRSDTAARATPEVTMRHGTAAAYWELEGAAYVLTGDSPREEMLAQASRLSRNGFL